MRLSLSDLHFRLREPLLSPFDGDSVVNICRVKIGHGLVLARRRQVAGVEQAFPSAHQQAVTAELVQAGELQDSIAEVYELPRKSVEAAVRYELLRASA